MISDGDQKSVLLRLHDQIDESKAEISAADIADSFRPNIDPLVIEFALGALVNAGLVINISGHPMRYRISRAGIVEVETTHNLSTTINPSTGVVHRSYSELSVPPIKHVKVDWTKWGTILGAVAIMVTIAIAVIQ